MSQSTPNIHLILTVGTGINTAERKSSLIDGLRTTIEKIKPSKFWLIPSKSDDSIAVAELVRDGFPSFEPWSEDEDYLHIIQHDSLECSRDTVKKVIQKAQQSLGKNDRLIVNPTSGTKQMSSGATVAALDENIGELVFTIGDRADGIVKTGTERLETFVARDYFAERDFKLAQELYQAGSYAPAAQVLKPYPNRFEAEIALCRCFHFWEQLDYEQAWEIAKTKKHPRFSRYASTLRSLADDADAISPTPALANDVLKSATRFHARANYPEVNARIPKNTL